MVSDDQEFFTLLQRLIPLVQENLTEQSAHLVLQTLSFLTHCGESDFAGEEKRKAAQQAITQLSTPPLLSFYINLLCARTRFNDHRIGWDKMTRALGDPLAKQLLTRLAVEEDQSRKKAFSEALISQGEVALAAIFATLKEDRWPVLRNAVQLLGEIRSAAAIEPLRALLHHRDLRVRREVLRALTRIGGNSVIAIIAKILQEDDNELRRQAMLSLGAIKNPATTPLLVQFLQVKDWRLLQLEVKVDAIRALGEIGSAEVLPELMAIVNRRCLFYRSRNDVLRAAALLAMSEIGGPEAIDFLETMEDSSSPIVAKAAISALRQVRKGS
jgi:HEAT repeat protein